jgi:CBS-domain-containing membrane protein
VALPAAWPGSLHIRNAPIRWAFAFQAWVTSAALHVVSARMCDRTKFVAILAGATGGAVAIAGMEALSARAAFPLVAIPFATSIVTVLGSPKAEPAQPRALIGGHLVSTFVGLLIVKLFGPGPWAAALAVGLAMVAMHLTGTFHPPAGIDPLVVVVNDMSWDFLLAPVAIGAILLALFALAWHGLVGRGANRDNTWPTKWW